MRRGKIRRRIFRPSGVARKILDLLKGESATILRYTYFNLSYRRKPESRSFANKQFQPALVVRLHLKIPSILGSVCF